MTDYQHEEAETDRLIDAGLCPQCGAVSGVNHLCAMGRGGTSALPPLTQAEIDAQRVRPFRKAWDIDRFKRPGRVVNGMCEHGACDWCPHGCFDDAQRPMTDAERKRIIDKVHRAIYGSDEITIDEARSAIVALNHYGFLSDEISNNALGRLADAERVQPAQSSAAS